MSKATHLCMCHKCGYEESVWYDDEDFGYVPECKTRGCSNYGERIYDIEDISAFSSNEHLLNWASYERSFEEFNNNKEKLFDRLKNILKWENENLGKHHEVLPGSNWKCLEISKEEGFIWFHVEEVWAYGGYDEKEIDIPLYKFFSDDWKISAIEEYKKSLEKQEKEREKTIEEKDRAEFERLKKKFGY